MNKCTTEFEREQINKFRRYKSLPVFIWIVIAVIFFIWGIVDTIVFQVEGDYGVVYFGMFRTESPLLNILLIWPAIGMLVGLVGFILAQIKYSYYLLQIYYLQELLGDKIEEDCKVYYDPPKV